MKNETKERIESYKEELPRMKEKVAAAGAMFLIALITAVTATYAWVTISRAPEVSAIATTVAANGNLEIALSDEDGQQPDEFDVDENAPKSSNVVSSNLQWGNLINLSDASYGIDNLALRPAQLNTASLLTSPLWGAAYGGDGRITMLDSNYAYAKYDGKQFMTSNKYGVRAIASYKATVADSTQAAYNEKATAVMQAHTAVNTAYSAVPGKFAALGTMISKYAQDKLNEKLNDSTSESNLAPYLKDVYPLYLALQEAMEAQKDAYVALANFQAYVYANNNNLTFNELTWSDIEENEKNYNTANAETASKDEAVSLVGLTQFIKDRKTLDSDMEYLLKYKGEYEANSTPYYWSSGGDKDHQINNIIANLIDYSSMTIDLNDNGDEKKVTSLGASDATALLGANGKQRKVYVYGGIMERFEQSAIDESYRLNGNAQCTIRVSYIMTITVYGKAYTRASGTSSFMQMYTKSMGGKLAANDAVAEDTYGMAVDLWVRTNAEQTCLTLEGATVVDDSTKQILRYDGVNRIWGSTADSTVLTTDSTTQGGGSCYIYYADTPEDMRRSLDLLEAMKVAFVDQNGKLLATAGMDTENYFGETGRITVPLALDSNTETTYEYTNALNETVVGRAITTLYTDSPVRIEAIIYLDGTMLTNDDVLAAAEIQGQLNLQFGSSTALETAGDNNLIDDTRTVTAEADRVDMDFDSATSNEELITTVTLHVQGTDPEKASAFFVRAINSTQGSREDTMDFIKQEDGTWTASYQFTAPGTYYLRHVRLDGVDYALAEPIKIEVSGFALNSVTWGEPTNSATVRSSASSYNEAVAVEFATNDANKMPNSVEARFVRTDGNTVNVPLGRGSDGKWTGTATFTTSGVYTLEYLVYKTGDSDEGKYKDLVAGGFSKTLDLALGMYVTVQDLTGSLTQNYEDGQTYSKDVAVVIYDNAGNVMSGLEGARLVYSNGGSATSTISTDLTWNELDARYDGTLPIIAAGRYQFAYVSLVGQSLTKATEAPVYTIISPEPPIYDEDSQSTYHTETQYVPLTNDAVIDRIHIKNAASARISAVVYNDKSKQYYTVDSNKVSYSGTTWSIALPTYTTDTDENGKPAENASYTQDGTWSVVALKLSECYDSSSTYRGEENPIIWVGNDDISAAYAKDNLVDENGKQLNSETKDFSKLSTTVSCSVKVKMIPGTTKLGGKDAAFMQKFQTNELGMSVELTDDAGNVIPAKKVTDVTLKLNYNPPTDNTTYGYKVQSGAARPYEIKLNNQDAESGLRTVSNAYVWQYVGTYTVESLTVNIGGKTLTYAGGDQIGVPTEYALTTQGPTADNISVENVKQTETVFGKQGNNITGLFLDSCKLKGTNTEVSLTPKDVERNQYAVMENVSAKLKLTYAGGSDTNGGYTWEGTSPYENQEVDMTRGDGNNIYTAGDATLLAGTYKAQIVVSVDGKTTTKNLNDISVYSKKPDVTMELASGTPTSVTVNSEGGTAAVTEDRTFTGNNTISNEGHSALLFAAYEPFTAENNKGQYEAWGNAYEETAHSAEFAHYIVPSLTFKLTNEGSAKGKAVLNNSDGSLKVSFKENNNVVAQIGNVVSGTEVRKGVYGKYNWECEYTYKTEYPELLGQQEITNISATVDAITYSIELKEAISIVQKNSVPPNLTFKVDDVDFITPDMIMSPDGKAFTCKLPTELETKDGKTSVTRQEVETTETPGEGSGEDPDTEANKTKIDKTLGWKTYDNIGSRKVWVQHETIESYTDWLHGVHRKKVTSDKFTETETKERATLDVTLTGTTFSVQTKVTSDVTISLEYWLVDGEKKAPGEKIEIKGNTIAIPVYKEDKVVKQTEERNIETSGKVVYSYEAFCVKTSTTSDGSGNEKTGQIFCSYKRCKISDHSIKSSDAEAKKAAENDNSASVTNGIYEKVDSAAVGDKYDFSESKWTKITGAGITNPVKDPNTTTKTYVKIWNGEKVGDPVKEYWENE